MLGVFCITSFFTATLYLLSANWIGALISGIIGIIFCIYKVKETSQFHGRGKQ